MAKLKVFLNFAVLATSAANIADIMSMVATASKIQNKLGKLSCANYGVHVAISCACHKQYVEQTKNFFFVRWVAHRNS